MKKAFTLTSFAVLFLGITLFAQERTTAPQATSQAPSKTDIRKNQEGVSAPESRLYPKGFEQSAPFSKLYEADGPYSYVKPSAEILDKRDATTKHFLNRDNTLTAVTTAGPSHYHKDGLWHTILNDIYPNSAFNGYSYAAVYNRFQTYYGNNLGANGIKVVTENAEHINLMKHASVQYMSADMQVLGTVATLNGNLEKVEGETATYTNAYTNTNIVVQQNAAGYELDYYLSNANWLTIPANAAYVSFTEAIKVPAGYTAHLDNNGSNVVIVGADNKLLLKYKTPVFFDKNDKYSDVRTKGKYHITQENDLIHIYVLVPAAWLLSNAEKELVIDPSVTITPPVSQYWTFTVDNDDGCDFGTDNDADENLRVGFDDGNIDNDFYQCYAAYSLSSVPSDACITSATTNWYQYNFRNPRNDDNSLQFYFQAYDPISTNPVGVPSCTQINNEINATATWYNRWNV